MKVHHALTCFFFIFQDGITGLFSSQILVYTGTDGGNITVGCHFYFSGGRMFFCRDKCTEQNILVETADDHAQSGRYSIEYKTESYLLVVVNVSITQLNKSDSGRYSCGLNRTLLPDSYMEFEINVTDASTSPPTEPCSEYNEITMDTPEASGPVFQVGIAGLVSSQILVYTGTDGGNITVGCHFYFSGGRMFFCKDKCTEQNILVETANDHAQSGRYSIEYKTESYLLVVVNVSITQLNKSDSGRYSCGLNRTLLPDSYMEFEINVTDGSRSSTPSEASELPDLGVVLYAGALLIATSIILAVPVVKRLKGSSRSPVKTAHDNVLEVNEVYENIREDRESTVFTVYTCANVVGTADEYSLATDTATCVEKRSEDGLSDLNYSEDASFNIAPCGNTGDVCSGPQVERGSANDAKDTPDSPPLYSNEAAF